MLLRSYAAAKDAIERADSVTDLPLNPMIDLVLSIIKETMAERRAERAKKPRVRRGENVKRNG